MYTIEDYYNAIDEIAGFAEAEEWDNVGLLVGSRKTKVKAALVALDVTLDVLSEAKLLHANLIITHHPVIFPSLTRIDGDSLLYFLISENMSVISAHTNFDMAENGVNDVLCGHLGLNGVRPLQSVEFSGLARLGELEKPMSSSELAAFVKERLNCGGVKFTAGKPVSTVAVCGGSGASLWRDAQKQNAQALITSEVKHHQFLEARQAGFTLIDAGHYATEIVAIKPLAERISRMLPGSPVTASQSGADPADYL